MGTSTAASEHSLGTHSLCPVPCKAAATFVSLNCTRAHLIRLKMRSSDMLLLRYIKTDNSDYVRKLLGSKSLVLRAQMSAAFRMLKANDRQFASVIHGQFSHPSYHAQNRSSSSGAQSQKRWWGEMQRKWMGQG